MQVMLDRDLAVLYAVETRALNQAVKRNQERFPKDYCFQLTDEEFQIWKSQIVITNSEKMGLRRNPFAFTERGIAMLSTVLHSKTSISVSMRIMDAFVFMRHFIADNAGIFQRLDRVETKLLNHDEKIDKIFKQLEISTPGNAAIFFMGTFYDARYFEK